MICYVMLSCLTSFLSQAEDEAAAMQTMALRERDRREEEVRARDEKARMYDAK